MWYFTSLLTITSRWCWKLIPYFWVESNLCIFFLNNLFISALSLGNYHTDCESLDPFNLFRPKHYMCLSVWSRQTEHIFIYLVTQIFHSGWTSHGGDCRSFRNNALPQGYLDAESVAFALFKTLLYMQRLNNLRTYGIHLRKLEH